MARNFVATTSQIDIGSDSSIVDIFNGGGTIMAWINPDTIGEDTEGTIMNTFVGGNGGYQFKLSDDGTTVSDLILVVDHSTTAGQWVTTSRDITYNQYQFVAVSYDDDATTNNPTFYIDTVKKTVGSGLTESATPVGTYDSNSGNAQLIGIKANGTSDFDGDLACYVMWTSVITDNQALGLAHGVNPIAISPDNLAYFGNIFGNDSPESDWSGNGNTGTVTNAAKSNHPSMELIENYL